MKNIKIVLLKDLYDSDTDGVFVLPIDADINNFMNKITKKATELDNDCSTIELINKYLPTEWLFVDKWGKGLTSVYY